MKNLVRTFAPVLLAGCGVLAPKPVAPPPRLDSGKIESAFRATSVGKRPPVLGLAREGDPFPAVALTVRVGGGPAASTALAAVVDARLARAKIQAETHVSRGGFDVRVLVREGASDAAMKRVVLALRDALATPVTDQATDRDDVRLAVARVAALRSQVVDDDALTPVVQCSGELRLTRAEARPETLVVSAATIEKTRAAAYGFATAALGLVGPTTSVEAGQRALFGEPEWPTTSVPSVPWPSERSEAAYVRAGRGPSRLSVALRVPGRSAALRVAERAADPSSPLIARLRALPTSFATRQVAATVHDEGGCVTVEAEAEPKTGTASGDAEVAASAALVIEHELLAELAEKTDDSFAASQIRGIADPREAAAAAANWALSRDAGSATAPLTSTPLFAFGAAAPRAKEDPTAVTAAFSNALREGERAWARSAIENRVAVEQHQGQLWLLLASPCPLHEAAHHAGLTALSLDALASAGFHRGVTVEPWIAPDGYGLLVHAARLPTESSEALATRVANAAARLLALDPPSSQAVFEAKQLLLPRLETPTEAARAKLATTLFPSAATRLVPWGTAAAMGRLTDADVRLRWGGFATSPLRAAVLANEDSAQATAALRAIDRWIPRTTRVRTCGAVDDVKMPADPLTLAAEGNGVGTVYLVYPFDGSASPARLTASYLATLLDGPDSPAAMALGKGARASATVVGRGPLSLLVVELVPTETPTDAAIASARAAIVKVANDPLAAGRAAEARGRLAEQIDARKLSPRERLIALWRADAPLVAPSDAELRAIASATLRDDAVRVVRTAPPK